MRYRVAEMQRGILGREHAEVPRAVQRQSAFHDRGDQRHSARRGGTYRPFRPANRQTTRRRHPEKGHRRAGQDCEHRDVNRLYRKRVHFAVRPFLYQCRK